MRSLLSSLGGEQALVLALLPFEGIELRSGKPGVHRGPQRSLTPQSCRKGHVRELDPEPAQQLAKAAELVQLAKAVQPVTRRRSGRSDERRALDVAEHPGRPARERRGLPDRSLLHGPNLNIDVSRLRAGALLAAGGRRGCEPSRLRTALG